MLNKVCYNVKKLHLPKKLVKVSQYHQLNEKKSNKKCLTAFLVAFFFTQSSSESDSESCFFFLGGTLRFFAGAAFFGEYSSSDSPSLPSLAESSDVFLAFFAAGFLPVDPRFFVWGSESSWSNQL